MANNIFNGNMPPIDISYTANLASGIQRQIEENNRRSQLIAEEAYNNRQRMQKAIEETAANTAETNVHIQKVIENQNEYIDMLKEQIAMQKKQLEFDEQQLKILKDIFESAENGTAIENEIKELIQKQIDSSHPLWDYIKDKGRCCCSRNNIRCAYYF